MKLGIMTIPWVWPHKQIYVARGRSEWSRDLSHVDLLVYLFHFILQITLSLHQWTSFWWCICYTTCFHARKCLLGVALIRHPMLGSNSHKKNILGCN